MEGGKKEQKKKSNFKKIAEGVGGGLLLVGGIAVEILKIMAGKNGNQNFNNKA